MQIIKIYKLAFFVCIRIWFSILFQKENFNFLNWVTEKVGSVV